MSNSMTNMSNTKGKWRKFCIPFALAAGVLGLAGCQDAATVVSHNLSKAADNFEIPREIVFYNGITGEFFATVTGRCSIEVDAIKDKLDVTCKHGPDDFRKHFLGLSDNVTFFVLQTAGVDVSEYNTRITFNPQGFIPDIDLRGNLGEAVDATRPVTHGEPIPEGGGAVVLPEGKGKGTLPELTPG